MQYFYNPDKKSYLEILKKDFKTTIHSPDFKDLFRWIKIKRLLVILKNNLGWFVMKKFFWFHPKIYFCLKYDGIEEENKSTEKCVVKKHKA